VTDTDSLEMWADEAIKRLPKAVEDFKGGNDNALQALVGMMMQLSKGKVDPKLARNVLLTKLS